MGIILSAPISVFSSIATSLTCCVAQGTCSCLESITSSSHLASRIVFFFLFLSTCIGALVASNYVPNVIHIVCFGLCISHLLYFVVFLGAKSQDKRILFQNGFWAMKFGILGLLIGLGFYVPFGFLEVWANWISSVFGIVFILLQLIYAIDFAYTVTEKVNLIEDEQNQLAAFVTITSILLVASTALSIYVCFLSLWLGIVNIIFCILVCIIATREPVLEETSSGLLTASVMVMYCTYLCYSSQTASDKVAQMIMALFATGYSAFKTGSIRISESEDPLDYDPSLFHLLFALAACSFERTATMWTTIGQSIDFHDAIMWIKISSSWIAFLLYIYTLLKFMLE